MGYFAVKGFLFFLLCVIEQIHSEPVRDNDLIVKLASPVGKIRGHILQSGNGKNYYAFQQIPYAAAPVGNLRFKPPQPRETWDGILDTTAHTKRCPQAWVNDVQQTEDCLNLNVYTPVKPNSNKKLAVYVWIFGGGFQIGDGSNVTYNPKYFMDYDVVVVTLDYRLGILGFLTTEDGVIPGNLGLRDQHFALEWVQKNIHLFGGDPTRVTIGGESAGAASVAFQTIGDLNNGKLFRGAIQQSGSGLNRWAYQNRPTYYAFKAGQFLDSTLRSGDSNQLLKVLLKANFSQLIDIQEKITNEEKIVGLAEDQIWVPVVEKPGKGQTFLSSPMHDTFRFKQWHKVPTLIGMNSEEGAWFLPSEPVKNSWELSWEQVRDRASDTDKDYRNLISDKLNIPENEKARAGEELKKIYTNGTFLNDLRAFTRFSSDAFVMQPIMRQAVLEAHDNDVYFYQFSYNGRNSSFMPGAAHTDELPYFWEFDVELTSEFDLKLRHRLLKLWTNFIKYQNPTPAADNDLENILWPKLHCFSCCKFLDINVNLTIQRELRNYQKYARVLEKYVQEPWYVY